MSITGYSVELSTTNGKEYVCKDCADKIRLTDDGRQVKKITTEQYQHGSGGGPCIFCGTDVLSVTSSVKSDRPNSFDPYAAALLSADAVDFAATDSNVENESDGAVKFPDLSPSSVLDSVLIVEVPQGNSADAETIQDLLEQAGFEIDTSQPVDTYYELIARSP